MIVLQPGDSVHLTLWFNEHKQTQEEAYAAVLPIFAGNGIHIFSWTAISGVPAFPMHIIAFRREGK